MDVTVVSQHNPTPERADSKSPGPRLASSPTVLHPGEALILLGFGSFGATVLQILSQELRRFDISEGRVFPMVFDPSGSVTMRMDGIPDGGPPQPSESYERWEYMQRHESLRQAVSHVPPRAFQGTLPRVPRLPAQGLVDLHHDDEHHFTGKLLALVDQARAANPDRIIRCIAVWALGDAFAAGAAVPLLFRVRDHLEHRKVTLEAFLVSDTPVRGAVEGSSPDDVDDACIEVASAMLWERTILGDGDVPYPGKEGVREDRLFRGPLAHRTWIFSSAGSNSPSAVASAVARCIETLSTTRLGRRLEAERVRYTEDILERCWSGPRGIRHPTSLLSLNVGGLKIDTLPAIFHLRRARHILDSFTAVLGEDEEHILRDEARRHLENAGIQDAAISENLGVGRNPLTLDEVEAAQLPMEELHGYLSKRLENDLETLYAFGNGTKRPAGIPALLAGAEETLRSHAQAMTSPKHGALLRVIAYYRALERYLEERQQAALQRQQESSRILASLADKKRLATLLERIGRDTSRQKSKHWTFIERFVSTVSVSVPMQVRKILEVATGVRQTALQLATATTLVDIYGQVLHFCERQREDLQLRLRTLNNVASLCSREEDRLQRTARSAYTYPRTRIDTLLERLCALLSEHTQGPLLQETDLYPELLHNQDDENAWYERILQLARPDATRLSEVADEIVASEPLVREALKESLAQFAPMVQLDRDRFAQLPTVRLRYVLCTRWMYEVNRDLFDGYEHIETENPYNIFVTQHEEGLPFIALRCLRRAQETYRNEESPERTRLAHAQACFATELPRLDD